MKMVNYDRPTDKKLRTLETVKTEIEVRKVQFLQLMFTDISGMNKNVEVPKSQIDKALSGQILFDGSSIDGFVRIEESDMLLVPDLTSFRVYPWEEGNAGRVGRVLCDVCEPNKTMFEGCPRSILKKQLGIAKEKGFSIMIGPEAEFFLFETVDGEPTTVTHDSAGYFDSAPYDLAENARREIASALQDMDIEIEATHHEVAHGQHEIDFRYGEALSTADNLVTLKHVVRRIAANNSLHATFMPKPIAGINGSGMHIHVSVFDKNEKNNLFAADNGGDISDLGKNFVAGVLNHAKAICAVTNPLVNSYKRLVPGFEAPTLIAWSKRNRSPLIRIPAKGGLGSRMELRMPDPSCNPYLAFAVVIAAGLDGIEKKTTAPAPVTENVYEMTESERENQEVGCLPANLSEAIGELERCDPIRDALGEHVLDNFVKSKKAEWQDYISSVHNWERLKYLKNF